MAAKRCSSSREGRVLPSCWIRPELPMQLERVWAVRMIAAYLAAQPEN